MIRRLLIAVQTIFMITGYLYGQTIREYTVQRALSPPVIDGKLTEPDWQAAAFTEKFVKYQDGSATQLDTEAKFLWDDDYLYIGFVCQDPDVWATMTNRDDLLWNGEVVEILCDPDGDGKDYIEIQVNPLGTMLDLFLEKPYSVGGQADIGWNLNGLKAQVWVDGTLNDQIHKDTQWTCEVALPFKELAFTAPSMNFPPKNGDSWRILVTRYDYERTGDMTVEISSWNQTDSRGFHVPEKFGRILFSQSVVDVQEREAGKTVPADFGMIQNYPNPFNPATTIMFNVSEPSHITLRIFDILGKEILTLMDDSLNPGKYQIVWDSIDESGQAVTSGVYFVYLQSNSSIATRKILLAR
jgi:hypothetical protein